MFGITTSYKVIFTTYFLIWSWNTTWSHTLTIEMQNISILCLLLISNAHLKIPTVVWNNNNNTTAEFMFWRSKRYYAKFSTEKTPLVVKRLTKYTWYSFWYIIHSFTVLPTCCFFLRSTFEFCPFLFYSIF